MLASHYYIVMLPGVWSAGDCNLFPVHYIESGGKSADLFFRSVAEHEYSLHVVYISCFDFFSLDTFDSSGNVGHFIEGGESAVGIGEVVICMFGAECLGWDREKIFPFGCNCGSLV